MFPLDFDGEETLKKNENDMFEPPIVAERVNPMQTDSMLAFSNVRVANAEGGHVTLTQAHFDDLHATLQRLQLVVDESNATLKQYRLDMEAMRRVNEDAFRSTLVTNIIGKMSFCCHRP